MQHCCVSKPDTLVGFPENFGGIALQFTAEILGERAACVYVSPQVRNFSNTGALKELTASVVYVCKAKPSKIPAWMEVLKRPHP